MLVAALRGVVSGHCETCMDTLSWILQASLVASWLQLKELLSLLPHCSCDARQAVCLEQRAKQVAGYFAYSIVQLKSCLSWHDALGAT